MSDVFDLFGPKGDPDPKLVQALKDLERAVESLGGFTREPDLLEVAMAVQGLLEAAGSPVAEGIAALWANYERNGREASRRQEAWARCDALFKLDLKALENGWSELPSTGPSGPTLPWPDDKP